MSRRLLLWCAVVVWLGSVAPARADQLYLTFADPIGDNTGPIDVTRWSMMFDTVSGAYQIMVRTTAAAPLSGEFRINNLLYNPVAGTGFDEFRPIFNLTTPLTAVVLTGVNSNLTGWRAGNAVASNTFAGLGNPPGVTLFRTSVTSIPFAFLTNEDAIAYGPNGSTVIMPLLAQPGVADFLISHVENLLGDGTLAAHEAARLNERLTAALAAFNANQDAAGDAELRAFDNEVGGLVSAGTLSPQQAEDLLAASRDTRAAPVAAGSTLEVSGQTIGVYLFGGPVPTPIGPSYDKLVACSPPSRLFRMSRLTSG